MKNRLLLLLISLLLTVSLCGQTISVKTCKSCGKPLAQCEYKGKHPTIPSVSFEGEPSSVHIYIDDDYKGTNANAIPISGGNHRVKYSSEGYADLIDEIYISDDPFQTIKYHLYPKKYNVTIKCSVDVKIWVDDEYKGSVPVNIPLSKGQHKLRAVDTNVLYEEHTSTFTVSHDNQVISFDMVKFQANNSSASNQTISSQNNQTTNLPQQQSKNNSAQKHGILNGHEYVDLGLSVKWATCNINASSSHSSGDYFAFGEVKPKSTYTQKNYKEKLVSHIEGKRDAATAIWGKGWRLPSKNEFEELIVKCSWTWDGSGFHIVGPNGNSIYLPAAGWKSESTGSYGIMGAYRVSDAVSEKSSYAYRLNFTKDHVSVDSHLRDIGYSIRPVTNY